MQYDLGDTVLLEHTVRIAGDLTDATVTLAVTSPAGTVSNPAVTHVSVGSYRSAVPATLAGPWSFSWDVSGPIDDVVPGQFSVGNPAPPAYAALADFKEMRRVQVDTDDVALQRVLGAASRLIDRKAGRRFWLDPTASARVFAATGRLAEPGMLLVDDIGDQASIGVEYGIAPTWSAVTGATFGPDNALVTGSPITQIVNPSGTWPAGQQVRIVARWGWPAIPDEITEATLLLANRLYLRKDSPEGVAGGEWGGMRLSRLDPDVEALVAPYVLFSVA